MPKVYEIEIDYSRIDTLLKKAIKIWNSKTPPEGRSKCKDCAKLEALFAIQSNVENELSLRDQRALWMSGNDPLTKWNIMKRLEDRKALRLSALRDIGYDSESPRLSDEGIAGNWEFLGGTEN